MVSINTVKDDLADSAGRILILMQEGDSEHGFVSPEWADDMYGAYELVRKAIQSLDQAELHEAGS